MDCQSDSRVFAALIETLRANLQIEEALRVSFLALSEFWFDFR